MGVAEEEVARIKRERAERRAPSLQGGAAPGKRASGRPPGWWKMVRAWMDTGRPGRLKGRAWLVFTALLRRTRMVGPQARYEGGLEPIARVAGCSHRSVTKALGELERAGMIKRSQVKQCMNGAFRSSVHVWPQDPPKPEPGGLYPPEG